MDKRLQELMFDHKHIIRSGPAPGEQDAEFKMRLDESFIKINDYLMKTHDEDPFESMSKNSAHSFTEGMNTTVEDMSGEKLDNPLKGVEDMDYIHKRPNVYERFAEYTLDHQIEFMKRQISQPGEISAKTVFVDAIIHNLESIKRWNESPAYHGKVDVEKVIEDLIAIAKSIQSSTHQEQINYAVANAEAALGMLQAFKQERRITPQDVADAHHAGKNILDRKTWSEYPYMIQQKKRDELVDKIRDQLEMPEGGMPSSFLWQIRCIKM